LDENNAIRKKSVEEYVEQLEDVSEITIPFKKHPQKSSHHIFPIILSDKVNRGELQDRLKEEGIQTSIHYPPIHLFKFYQERFGLKEGMLLKTEFASNHEVTLPLHPLMTKDDVGTICNLIKNHLR
jgi:dTDP-4-amino-4,6-dideoxygalactose transaminase